jgi:hypothetical protein
VRAGKILVLGEAEAGKSTLISALSPGAMNLEVNGRTVAMDHGTLDLDGCPLSLVGVPGQRRFAPVREALAAGALGVVWVHRHGRRVDDETARLVAELCCDGIPYLVFINRPLSSPDGDGWERPEGLPKPRAVVAGDPLTDSALVRWMAEEIRQLVGDDRAGSEKGA